MERSFVLSVTGGKVKMFSPSVRFLCPSKTPAPAGELSGVLVDTVFGAVSSEILSACEYIMYIYDNLDIKVALKYYLLTFQ